MCKMTLQYCVVFVSMLTIAMTTGCQQQSSPYFGTVKPRHGPQELWINNSSEPEWLDPGRCSDSTGGEIIWNTFEGLVQAHPATLKPLPAIATHWDISNDGRVYRFYLRPSFWSDGHPLTADDFVFALRRLVDPQTGELFLLIDDRFLVKDIGTRLGYLDVSDAKSVDDGSRLYIEHSETYIIPTLENLVDGNWTPDVEIMNAMFNNEEE